MKHAMERGQQWGGEGPVGTQCLGEEGILTPGLQVWVLTHAVRGITWMPGETERIKMSNPAGLLSHPSCFPKRLRLKQLKVGPPQQVKGSLLFDALYLPATYAYYCRRDVLDKREVDGL